MTCYWTTLPDGTRVHINMGRGRQKQCKYPRCRAAGTIECDHEKHDLLAAAGAKPPTCDRLTCRAHAKPIGPNVDWCWLCAREEAKK
jgi:hypothetical protein